MIKQSLYRRLLLCITCWLYATCVWAQTARPFDPQLAMKELHKGVNFGFTARNGYYDSPEGRAQIAKMAESGVTWVGVTVSMWQDSYSSTRVYRDYKRSPNEAELERIIQSIHDKAMRVMLYLCLELHDGQWRASVNFPDTPQQIGKPAQNYWQEWFASYTDCCINYAKLCQRTGAELLCLGAEYNGVVHRSKEWSTLVDSVRASYKGPLAYEAHGGHIKKGEGAPDWFKKLDIIGFSFYYGAAKKPGETVEEMVEHLKPSVEHMRTLSEITGKPILFTESGCRSRAGGAMTPADWSKEGRYDGQEQANYLEAVLRSFAGQSWWRGLYWWKWDEQNPQNRPHYYTDPAGPMGFEMYGKPAAQVYKKWGTK